MKKTLDIIAELLELTRYPEHQFSELIHQYNAYQSDRDRATPGYTMIIGEGPKYSESQIALYKQIREYFSAMQDNLLNEISTNHSTRERSITPASVMTKLFSDPKSEAHQALHRNVMNLIDSANENSLTPDIAEALLKPALDFYQV